MTALAIMPIVKSLFQRVKAYARAMRDWMAARSLPLKSRRYQTAPEKTTRPLIFSAIGVVMLQWSPRANAASGSGKEHSQGSCFVLE